MRLAEHVAKTTDVDAMLSKMSHTQFDEWCAKDLIEPIGSQPDVCRVLARIAVLITGLMGTKTTETDFAPWLEDPEDKREVQQLTIKQSAAVLRSHIHMIGGAN